MAMAESGLKVDSIETGFKPVRLVLAVLAILAMIFFASRWYATTVLIPRYCAEPEAALQRLAALLSDDKPAGNGPRRDFIVAARLGFLLPAQADESAEVYLRRLRDQLERECGWRAEIPVGPRVTRAPDWVTGNRDPFRTASESGEE